MSERVRLDDAAVGGLSCPEGRKDRLVFDGTLKGFGVRVTRDGTKVFLLQYRSAIGTRRLPIGTFGAELTTAQARKKAEALRGRVRAGCAIPRPSCRPSVPRLWRPGQRAAKQAAAEARYTLRKLAPEPARQARCATTRTS